MKAGIISDTHDLLRHEVMEALRGCDMILHGGDISSPGILKQLEKIASVKAVRGNNDKEWAEGLPLYLDFEMSGLRVFMTHKKKDIPKDVSAYDLVVYGHSHQYAEAWADSPDSGKRTLLLNPGSCGPRRFHQAITMAVLTISDDSFVVERIEIPHTAKETAPRIDPANIRLEIETVIRETEKGRGTETIVRKYGMEKTLVEQIVRLYVTHPGVTVDGIMTKMGIS